MPKINILPMYSDQGGPETLKRKLEAARLIMGDTNRTPEIYSTGQGLAHAGSKMLAGFLAGRAERENDQEEDAAWNPLQDLVTRDLESFGQGASASSPSSDPSQPRVSYSAGSSEPSGSGLPSMVTDGSGDMTVGALKKFEGFRTSPYWDVNAYRVGYGSDTVTDPATGRVARVTPGMKITPEMADADLARRIPEFQERIIRKVPTFAKMPEGARAALTSITYNYGDLPDSVAQAAASGDASALAQAVRGLSRHNGGVNAKRRMQEADMIETAYASGRSQAPAGRGFDLPEFDLSAQRSKIAMASRMMQNRRTREAGWALYQQAIQEAQAIQGKRIEYMMELDKQRRTQEFEREKLDREDFRAEQDRDLKKDAGQLDREKFDYERNKPMVIGGSSRLVSPEGKVIVDANPQVGGEITLPDGTTVRTGPKLTEQQSKDVGFYERGASAELELREREEALTEFMSKNAGNLPAIGNYFKSPEYRQAEVPARNFLAAILRKDSGGAITAEEMQQYGGMFLPQPGDDQETIRLKRQARAAAIKSIKKGLGPAEALAEAYPKLFDGKSLEPKPQEDKKPHPEARRGTDGKWYRPDPSRPGKYLVLE